MSEHITTFRFGAEEETNVAVESDFFSRSVFDRGRFDRLKPSGAGKRNCLVWT